MNTNFKKLVAGASILALVGMNLVNVNAANINDATAVANGNAQNATITVTSTGNFPDADEIATATIKNLDGTAIAGTTLTVPAGASGTADTSALTIATADLTNDLAYIVYFTTVSGKTGIVTVNVGTPTNNVVNVSATVLPYLSLNVASNTLTLGELIPGANKSSSDEVSLTVATNASVGATVIATSNGGLTSTTASYTIDDDNAENYGLAIAGATMGAFTNIAQTNAFTDVGNNKITIVNTGAPTAGVTKYIKSTAQITNITPAAGDYSDTLTFTVTGSF